SERGVYLKILGLWVPRERKCEHRGGVKAMSDEEIEQAIELIKELIAKRDAAANAKVIDDVPEPVPALPPPSRKARRKMRRSDRADSGLELGLLTRSRLMRCASRPEVRSASPKVLEPPVGRHFGVPDRVSCISFPRYCCGAACLHWRA